MRRLLSLLLFLPTFAFAQAPNTILVLDGSGSMWGQIEGTNKIVIARDVVSTILEDFPQEQALGLTVYGHRVRGDCTDIETVVAPDLGTGPAIREAVNGINPRGKTPMTDAIIRAAENLRYTEEAATVILVSDGIETCNPDPCAAAAALEQAGIDFTAHVVGFDVSDPAALAQMQCIADGTGGEFIQASNAAELTSALTRVAVTPEPIPARTVEFRATAGDGGPLVDGIVRWSITPRLEAGEEVTGDTPRYIVALDPGDYALRAQWEETGESLAEEFFVDPGTDTQVVTVAFEAPVVEVPVIFEARVGSESGPLVDSPVFWTVTAQDSVELEPANPAEIALTQGSYTVTAYWAAQEVEASRQFIATGTARTIALVFEEPMPTASLVAPREALAASTIEVAWNAEEGEGDYVGIGLVDATGSNQWRTFARTTEGETLSLRVPPVAGEHLITYFRGGDREPLAQVPLQVLPHDASVTVPAEASVGSTIEIPWQGPDYAGDYIGLGAVDATGSAQWESFAYTADGNPALLSVPAGEGDYVVRYFLELYRTPIASAALTVVPPRLSLVAPDAAAAGSMIEVAWEGPDADGDYIGIGRTDATGSNQWETFTYTEEGNPLQVRVPTQPGEYLVQYFLRDGRVPLVQSRLVVTPQAASLLAPSSAPAGDEIEVAWEGPGFDGDYIG
ncbi:MAG: vWA domain-containing protein, partial [Shimia sp.]